MLGKGPSLLTQCYGKDLSTFDRVVRVNNYLPIYGVDEHVTTWTYYPLHHLDPLGRPEFENKFDVMAYLEKSQEIWIVHEFTMPYALEQLKSAPDFLLSDFEKNYYLIESDIIVPTTGMLALWAAMRQGYEVWAAGFDFYQGGHQYYFDKTPPKKQYLPHDDPLVEKAWFDKKVKEGVIHLL